jgi:CheY-like chemotaxis protein
MRRASGDGTMYARDRTMVRGDGEPHPKAEVRNSILLVEDEVLIRMMIADKLREAGHTVIEASNADEALEVLRHSSIGVRVVLSDIQMPGAMDGVGLAREVRSRYPVIKIVLTSGHLAGPDYAEHDGFFSKPCDLATIISHIKTLLD